MTSAAQRLLEEALHLSSEDREWIAESLLESSQSPDPSIEAAWDAEVAKRLDQIESGQAELVPYEEVMRRVDAIIRKA